MLSNFDLVCRLTSSVLAGVVIGVNREMHSKPVGTRTLGLVGLGAALVTLSGSGFSGEMTDANASRAIQGIITGIGFLGAGVIVKADGQSHVHGLTTAAAIWVTAALGIACGLGAYLAVAITLVLMLLVLLLGGSVDRAVYAKAKRKPLPPTSDD